MSESESNRQRRLRDAVENLPEPFPTTRSRNEGEQLSRHLSALRARLEHLERLEDRDGDEQKNRSTAIEQNETRLSLFFRNLQTKRLKGRLNPGKARRAKFRMAAMCHPCWRKPTNWLLLALRAWIDDAQARHFTGPAMT